MKNLLSVVCVLGALAVTLLAAEPVLAYDGEVYTVCKLDPSGDNYLSLRSCRSGKCAEKRRLRPGQFVWTEEPFPEGGWRAVRLMKGVNDLHPRNGLRGFVYDEYICYVDMTR